VKIALLVLVSALVVSAGAAGGGLYLYDRERDGLIAEGVVAAGVDLSGMTVPEARAALEGAVAQPLAEPIRVDYGDRGWFLHPREAGVRIDVDRMVALALAESRKDNFVSRAIRDVTGRSLDFEIPLRADYSDRFVATFVREIGKEIFRKPREAKFSYTVTRMRLRPSRRGVVVLGGVLAKRLGAALVRPDSDRTIALPTRPLRPKTSTRELRRKYRYFITVSRPEFKLRFFVNFKLAKTYPISVGQIGYETPTGVYQIQNKAVNPSWFVPNKPWAGELAGQVIPPGPENPIKARWMGIYDGAGIHGTDAVDSIGTSASHGCIRMLIPDVIELYERVPVRTPVYIA
jgi:hypothetical protein